jgi:hypothetical protein
MLATTIAAKLESIERSPSEIPPLPPATSNVPTMKPPFHCARVGRGAPVARITAYKIAPATSCLVAAMYSGGNPTSGSIASRIARYVDPQIT